MRSYLLVDDNRAFAENLAEIVSDTGDTVTIATGGAEALELVRQYRFDALVTDMRMPLISGADLVHAVRRIDPGLPTIVVTAYTGENDIAAARQEGILAVLGKPIPIARLLSLLSMARRDGLVVIVEDDAALGDNLSEMLRDKGFSALTASSIAETDRLGPLRPFVALVDIRVPGGPDGAAFERVEAKFPAIPKLIMTAYSGDMPRLNVPVYDKPFDSQALLAQIEALHAKAARS